MPLVQRLFFFIIIIFLFFFFIYLFIFFCVERFGNLDFFFFYLFYFGNEHNETKTRMKMHQSWNLLTNNKL